MGFFAFSPGSTGAIESIKFEIMFRISCLNGPDGGVFMLSIMFMKIVNLSNIPSSRAFSIFWTNTSLFSGILKPEIERIIDAKAGANIIAAPAIFLGRWKIARLTCASVTVDGVFVKIFIVAGTKFCGIGASIRPFFATFVKF